jgi:hypothetical protein
MSLQTIHEVYGMSLTTDHWRVVFGPTRVTFFIVHHVALFVLYTFTILHGIIPEDSNSHCFVIAGCVTCNVLCDY